MEKMKEKWMQWDGLSASTIKCIAMVAMLIDHIGAAYVGRLLSQAGIMEVISAGNPAATNAWLLEFGGLYSFYRTLRMIGRMAFPIYCYFLVEGMKYTKSAPRYLLRLLIFAMVSEVPFDLLFNGAILETGSQNVYFTLAIGLGVMIAIQKIRERFANRVMVGFLQAVAFLIACGVAELFHTDYSYMGVISIALMYVFSVAKPFQIGVGALSFCWGSEFPVAPLTFGLLALYKKKRGWKLKYLFYVFYPLHLLLIYLAVVLMGLAPYSAL